MSCSSEFCCLFESSGTVGGGDNVEPIDIAQWTYSGNASIKNCPLAAAS